MYVSVKKTSCDAIKHLYILLDLIEVIVFFADLKILSKYFISCLHHVFFIDMARADNCIKWVVRSIQLKRISPWH